MKKVFLILAAGITILSCSEADKKADSTNSAASTISATTTDNAASPNTSNEQSTQVDKEKLTKIEWINGAEKDFGKMKEGEKLTVSFKFKNSGDKPLIISDVTAGCGCTVVEKPSTEPIAPGGTGEIKAAFDSQNQGAGLKSKNVNVFANTDPQMTTLTFRVEVKPKS